MPPGQPPRPTTPPPDAGLLENDGVELVHTPCSTIYLLPTLAYKVKKPVNLGWLDYRTLADRRRLCEEEIRLNAELAPGVYRRVVPVCRRPDGGLAIGAPPTGEPENYAVEMRRLPARGMLASLLERGEVGPEHLDAIVSRLAAFHAGCPRAPFVTPDEYTRTLSAEFESNLRELEPHVGVLIDQPDPRDSAGAIVLSTPLAAAVREFLTTFVARQRDRLATRLRAGRVVEGHGDLHAGNICFDPAGATPGNPLGLVIYDRLEFRLDFRCKDVAAELAHLAMTCDAHAGVRAIGDELLDRYARRTGDLDLAELSRGFRVHYALVRAKVHARRATQPDVSAADRRREILAGVHASALAAAYVAPPTLVLTCGLPGSGKSYVGQRLAPVLGCSIHRADEVRKELVGLKPTDRGGPELYTSQMSARTYAEVLTRCRADLAAGRHTIADATFRARANRAPFMQLARELGVPCVILHAHADEAETHRRLTTRAAAGSDASDADFLVYQSMAASFEPPTPDEAPVVKATPEIEPIVAVQRVIEHALAR